ncbi:uncharacterized protein [Littorina saxatilis]|uniref:Uncharacterized protein n=1 Tax=Littorina saxatilis TaxID=31220 RepID=A0AAN9GME3_9CAEN
MSFTSKVTPGQKQCMLRLMEAILKDDVDCTRIVTRDCKERGLDPRAQLHIYCCPTCCEKIRWKESSGDIMQMLTSGVCSDSCEDFKGSNNRVCLFDIAAARGHIDTLTTLPDLYDDITPRDQPSDAATAHLCHPMMTSSPPIPIAREQLQWEPPLSPSMQTGRFSVFTLTAESPPLLQGVKVPTQSLSNTKEADANIESSAKEKTLLSQTHKETEEADDGTIPEFSQSLFQNEEIDVADTGRTPSQQEEQSEDTFADSLDALFNTEEPESSVFVNSEAAADSQQPIPSKVEEGSEDSFADSLDALFHAEEEQEYGRSTNISPLVPSKQEDDTEDVFADSLDSLFHAEEEEEEDEGATASLNKPTQSKKPFMAFAECRHSIISNCADRRAVFKSAISMYAHNRHPLEKLVGVLKTQPCSEDVIDAFDAVGSLPECKDGSLDMAPLAREFWYYKGAHSSRTPLMAACRLGNERLLRSLFAEGKVEVNVKDDYGLTAFHYLCSSSDIGVFPNSSPERRRMVGVLLRYAAEQGQDLITKTPEDPQSRLHPSRSQDYLPCIVSCQDDHTLHTLRKRQSLLCRLAWNSEKENQKQLDQLEPLFDKEIIILCCMSCCSLLFPDVAVTSIDPVVVFSPNVNSNDMLFNAIESGECLCRFRLSTPGKHRIHFLPACAAAAAGNFALFRQMLQKFVERVERSQRESVRDGSHRSVLRGSAPTTRSRTVRSVHFDLSRACCHSERLVAQATRQLLYIGASTHALHVLDDSKVKAVVTLSRESKMTLVDLTLRMGDEETFMGLLDRFGLDLQSDTDGMTPLLTAVSWGKVTLARTLLRKGAKRGAVTKGGLDAIQIAFRLESDQCADEMALMLLEEGEGRFDPDNPRIPSTLQSAVRVNKREVIIDLLVQQGEVNVPVEVKGGQIAKCPLVTWVCQQQRFRMVNYLLDKGLDCISPMPTAGRETPLQMLVSVPHPEALKLVSRLIERGVDVNQVTTQGHNMLTQAVKSRNYKVLGRLILAGAIVDSLDNEQGEYAGDKTGSVGNSVTATNIAVSTNEDGASGSSSAANNHTTTKDETGSSSHTNTAIETAANSQTNTAIETAANSQTITTNTGVGVSGQTTTNDGAATNDQTTNGDVATNDQTTNGDVATNDQTTNGNVATNDHTTNGRVATNDQTSNSDVATNDQTSNDVVATNDKTTYDGVATNDQTTNGEVASNIKTTATGEAVVKGGTATNCQAAISGAIAANIQATNNSDADANCQTTTPGETVVKCHTANVEPPANREVAATGGPEANAQTTTKSETATNSLPATTPNRGPGTNNQTTTNGETPPNTAPAADSMTTATSITASNNNDLNTNGQTNRTRRAAARSRQDSREKSFMWHSLRAKGFRVAEMALLAGYRLSREQWFVTGESMPDIPPHLWQLMEQPLSLTSQCRRKVRERWGSSLPRFLSASGLPQSVVDFLLMKELVETYLDAPQTSK